MSCSLLSYVRTRRLTGTAVVRLINLLCADLHTVRLSMHVLLASRSTTLAISATET